MQHHIQKEQEYAEEVLSEDEVFFGAVAEERKDPAREDLEEHKEEKRYRKACAARKQQSFLHAGIFPGTVVEALDRLTSLTEPDSEREHDLVHT